MGPETRTIRDTDAEGWASGSGTDAEPPPGSAEGAAETLGQKTVAVHRRHYRILREPRLREIAELGAQQMRGKR